MERINKSDPSANRVTWLLMAGISIFAVLLTAGVRWTLAQEVAVPPAQAFKPQSPQGWGDDGIPEVGVEWINDFPGTADDRSHWDESCDGLYYGLTSVGWTGRFHWTDWAAFESDFKLSSLGGEEDTYVDNVDIAMVCTHGSGTHDSFWNKDLSSVYFGSTHDDHHLSPGEAYHAYGDKDLEFLAFDSCSVLSDGGPAPYYNRGYWSTVMNGLHLLLGFNNTMYVWAPGDGTYWALFMKGFGGILPPLSVTQSWFLAVDYNQPTVTCARVLAETNDNYNDHLYGYGYLGPDPVVDGYYWYWDHCSTGAKSLDLKYTGPTQLAVPAFQINPRLVDENYVRNRIAPSFNMTGTLGSDNLFFYLLDTSGGITRTLQVDKITGSYNFRNWGELWNTPIVTPTLPSGREAAAFTEEFFKMHGEALPGAFYRNAGYFYNVESLVQEMTPGFSVDGVQQVSQMPADGMLTYGRGLSGPALTTAGVQLADFPVVGPGGRTKLYFGDGGELIGAMGGSRDVTMLPDKLIEVIPAAEAWAMYLSDPSIAIPEVPWAASYISYTSATLGYYEMAYLTEQSEMIPVWIFNANFYGSGMELLAGDVPVYIPAALQYMPPVVSITEPVSGTLFSAGVPIQFKGQVQGGLAPYIFTWSSSQDGPLGDTLDILTALSGSEVKAGEVRFHVIKLDVTDSNGQSGTATVVVEVMANVYLPTIQRPIAK